MFRTQLYNPLVDPERQEYYDAATIQTDGYYLTLDHKEYFSPGTKLWHFYKSKAWHTIKSIGCRLVMISYTAYSIIESYIFFNEIILLFNLIYILLILVDCFIILSVRKGLEDRWCSLTILFFICANTTPFFMLEIYYNSFLTLNVFHPDLSKHIELDYSKEITNNTVLVIDSNKIWSDSLNKELYYNILSKHEAIFCIILIFSRLFLPQATLTWSAVSTMCEFSFNTVFDVYTTMSLCRDPKLNLPQNIIIACYIVSNGALISISLNLFNEDSDVDSKLNVSLLRRISDNFYFRLIIQILFADLPFLVIRIIIITRFQTLIRPDIYYLIAKQLIIINCKIVFMAYNWCSNYLKDENI